MINSHYLPHPKTIKFLCSYGGRIVPRHPDGKLRYRGGVTRVLSFNCSFSFHELLAKMVEMCGSHVSLIRCQFPEEELDSLVSIRSDEDLTNLIEEYDRVDMNTPVSSSSSSLKIRAFITVSKTAIATKKVLSPPIISTAGYPIKPAFYSSGRATSRPSCVNHVLRSPAYGNRAVRKVVGRSSYHACGYHHRYYGGECVCLVHHAKYWQNISA